MQNPPTIIQKNYKRYSAGLFLCLILTISAFLLISNHLLTGSGAVSAILALAFIQLWVQLKFFLNIGSSKENTFAFLLTMGTVAIVILGSIWIMQHLNYNMTPTQQNQYLQLEENIQK